MRWGILGPGRISRSFLTGLAASATEPAVAVGSRDLERARKVAEEFGIPRAYGSYEELLADSDVDAVYIGLPNALHAPWSEASALAGKHVLCEKPLGRSAAEVEEMIDVARRAGVRLMEAFMYRFHPRTLRLAELVAAGDLGEVRLVRGSFGFTVTDATNVRLSAELAGGALMDVGCYPVNAARMLAGPLSTAAAVARWAGTGVDETLGATLDHTGGAVSLVSCSLASGRHNEVQVVGTEGVIDVPDAFTPPRDRLSRLRISRGARGDRVEELTFEPVDQYTLEAEGFARLVETGDENRPQMPLAESLENAATIEALLRSAREGGPARV